MLDREDRAWARPHGCHTRPCLTIGAVEGVVPGWSTHDLVWHCAYWAGYTGDVLERLQRGEPEPEERDDDDVGRRDPHGGSRHGLGRGHPELEQSRERVRAALSAFGDPPELAVQWFTDDKFDHYEEHAAEIRSFDAAL